MDLWYDEDLPPVSPTLAQAWQEYKGTAVLAGKFVGIPTGLFILTCLANRWIDKKIGSL